MVNHLQFVYSTLDLCDCHDIELETFEASNGDLYESFWSENKLENLN